jgi:hypothetical protein
MEQATIYKSEDLNGLTGDNGERFCVFFRDNRNVLNSAWMWVDSKEAAEHVAKGNILVSLYGDKSVKLY